MPHFYAAFYLLLKQHIMDESVFRTAISAILSGDYTESDVNIAKQWLEELNKKELSIKRSLEKSKNEFSRKKNKTEAQLKTVRSDIKQLKIVLKSI